MNPLSPIPVSQDGNDFYGPNGLLWSAASVAGDFDLDGARLARGDFLRHCEATGLRVVFPSQEDLYRDAVANLNRLDGGV